MLTVPCLERVRTRGLTLQLPLSVFSAIYHFMPLKTQILYFNMLNLQNFTNLSLSVCQISSSPILHTHMCVSVSSFPWWVIAINCSLLYVEEPYGVLSQESAGESERGGCINESVMEAAQQVMSV